VKNKNKITFNDLVIPFCVAYLFMNIIYNVFYDNISSDFISMITITSLSFILMYGLFAFFRDFSNVLKDFSIKLYKLLKDVVKNRF